MFYLQGNCSNIYSTLYTQNIMTKYCKKTSTNFKIALRSNGILNKTHYCHLKQLKSLPNIITSQRIQFYEHLIKVIPTCILPSLIQFIHFLLPPYMSIIYTAYSYKLVHISIIHTRNPKNIVTFYYKATIPTYQYTNTSCRRQHLERAFATLSSKTFL